VSVDTEHDSAEREAEPGTSRRAGKIWNLTLIGLLVAYVGLAIYGLSSVFTASAPGPAKASGAVSAGNSAAAPVAAGAPAAASLPALRATGTSASHLLKVASVVAVGPDGTADGDNPEIASRILAANPGQPWYTQWYATPEFGNLRSGTGILLDMGETVTVSEVQLVLGSEPGADVQVRVGSSSAFLDLPTVASAASASGTVRLAATAPAKGQYVLIWFTRLPPDGRGHYQVSVYSAAVDGTDGP
jgi:hypothetical protein